MRRFEPDPDESRRKLWRAENSLPTHARCSPPGLSRSASLIGRIQASGQSTTHLVRMAALRAPGATHTRIENGSSPPDPRLNGARSNDAFGASRLPPELSARSVIRKQTVAATRGNERDAQIPAVRLMQLECVKPTHSRQSAADAGTCLMDRTYSLLDRFPMVSSARAAGAATGHSNVLGQLTAFGFAFRPAHRRGKLKKSNQARSNPPPSIHEIKGRADEDPRPSHRCRLGPCRRRGERAADRERRSRYRAFPDYMHRDAGQIRRAVALLHNFFYPETVKAFQAITKRIQAVP